MSVTWNAGTPPEFPKLGFRTGLRVLRRGLPMAIVIFGGACLLLFLRLIERPIFAAQRPWTPHLTRMACRTALWCMGLQLERHGQPMETRGALVANHSSWLDIFALNASDQIYFVSKSEVSGWPAIGWLARITGTVFIERNPKRAKAQTQVFKDRLIAGHRLLFFPEGTSTDNQRVLPFKSSLFAAFLGEGLRDALHIQAVSLTYHAPIGKPDNFYGWWGDMDFGSNLLGLLATAGHGRISVVYHEPVRASDFAGRKELAAELEAQVRTGLQRQEA